MLNDFLKLMIKLPFIILVLPFKILYIIIKQSLNYAPNTEVSSKIIKDNSIPMITNNISIVDLFTINYLNLKNTNKILPLYYKSNDDKTTIKKYISLGYIEEKYSLKNNLNKATLPELKHILKNNNLTISGNKETLISRILGNIDVDSLSSKFPLNSYFLTEKGSNLIKTYHSLIFLNDVYKNYLDNDLYNIIIKKINNSPNLNYTDILFRSFDEYGRKYNINVSFYKYSQILHLTYILLKSTKEYDKALIYLIAYLRLNISGVENLHCMNDIDYIYIYPDKEFRILYTLYPFTDDELLSAINYSDSHIQGVPFNFFNKSEVHVIIKDILNNNVKKPNEYKYNRLNKSYYKRLGFNIIDSSLFQTLK